MSVVRCGIHVGAAACVAGVLWAGPQVMGIAGADTGDADTHSVSAGPAKAVSGAANKAKRSPSAPRGSEIHRKVQIAPPRSAGDVKPARRAATRRIDSAPAEAAAAVAAPQPLTDTALPGSANPIEDLLDGVVLLIRRTFFNEAPTVNPVEIGGKQDGLITGTIGAVDPEGDPIEYRLLDGPVGGTVVIHSDGTYTYTPGDSFDGMDAFTVAATDTGLHVNLFDLLRSPSTDAAVTVFQNAVGKPQVIFQFLYGSSEYWTPEARGALEGAARDLASYIVVTTPVRITYGVTAQYSPGSGILATAGSPIYDTAVFNNTVVQDKILTGYDANFESADGSITWNFGYNWDYDGVVANDEIDFQTVALHELLHSLGFTSWVRAAGFNNTGAPSDPYVGGQPWTGYDEFIVTSSGTHAIGSTGLWNSAFDPNITGGNGGLYFGGANAVAAYGGLVPLYTPSYFDGGSIAHLDGVGDVMSHATAYGVAYSLSPVELGILEDLGYSVAQSDDDTLFL